LAGVDRGWNIDFSSAWIWRLAHSTQFPARRQGHDLSILPRVEEEFRALVVTSDRPGLCFDGRTAEIVDDRQEGDTENSVFTFKRVHRFVRNGITFRRKLLWRRASAAESHLISLRPTVISPIGLNIRHDIAFLSRQYAICL
jgi:hypothetical protein